MKKPTLNKRPTVSVTDRLKMQQTSFEAINILRDIALDKSTSPEQRLAIYHILKKKR